MTLERLEFDNAYARLPEYFYTRVQPTPRRGTRVLDTSPDCAELLGLEAAGLDDEPLRALMAGEQLLPGMDPLAQKYTGHQFGVYNPALGDGRGLLLGEVRTPHGPLDLHLKGSGQTPYSRFADGQAVLRSSIREYLVSEHLAALGIPTTRALAVAVNDERVQRETVEPGATLLRVAESHVRFGHFEWLAYKGDEDGLQRLADHVIERHRPWLREHETPYAALFEDVVARTAELIARWQAYGFVHAVMNTDNMSILGLTIDYGPYAFLDTYIPDRVPNHTDTEGRYAFDQQAGVALWNLNRLGNALMPLVEREALVSALESFSGQLQQAFGAVMRQRLGLTTPQDDDAELCREWLTLLYQSGADYHRAFRMLSYYDGSEMQRARLAREVPDPSALAQWLERYDARLATEQRTTEERLEAMQAVNPVYVLRTHIAQRAIEAAERGDRDELGLIRECLCRPFTPRPGCEAYEQAPPADEAAVCLSCSS
ncbi:hypothetical protein C7446_2638 [Kushneria sinocarnis]|uniref:Protein nucleotidyltransferase YdiU n=1 Tax=Kushneria sinocarnis TaxID=595502 RepID=A0A420WUU3_9GAMM|nr:YdiU family protein [Kushneria sinocarnis]RKQ97216.1 hypothetical protein C7446_2638 [Kushneria sinocarnis]